MPRARAGLWGVALLAGLALAAGMVQARVVTDDETGPDAALLRAIAASDAGAAEAALKAHAEPNRPGLFGAGPLALAVNAQNPAIVGALLKAGARPDMADVDGVTPLGLACELGNGGLVGQLLDAHAGLTASRPDGAPPLAICARFAPAEAVARMLALGAAPDAVDTRGQSPLMWAASAGKAETVALLIKAGADVNRHSSGGFTPLAFAIKSGSVPAAKLLLATGARTDWRGPENTSALQLALYQKNWDAAALMLEQMPDARTALAERNREGRLPLHVAAIGGDTALVGLMLERGADANALTGPSKITWVTEANFGLAPPPEPPSPPLLLAAAHGHTGVMKRLLAAGANPGFVAANGSNVVLAATQGGKLEALDLALGVSPDANVAEAHGLTPLHILAMGLAWSVPHEERLAMLRLLAAHGARPDIPSKPMGFGEKGKTETRGKTAAQLAAEGVSEVRADFEAVFPPATAAPTGTRLATAPGK